MSGVVSLLEQSGQFLFTIGGFMLHLITDNYCETAEANGSCVPSVSRRS